MKKKGAARKKSTTKTAKKGTQRTRATSRKSAAKPKSKPKRKIAKPKSAKKRTTAKKTTAKKKTTTKKKTAARKTTRKTTRKTAAKKGPSMARRAAATTPKSASQPARVIPIREPQATPASAEAPTPAPIQTPPEPAEQPIGTVTHYYSHLSVAVVQLNEGSLQVGDTIRIKGHTTNLEQPIESMEIDHQSVQQANSGQIFGLKVRDHVREHDQVFKG